MTIELLYDVEYSRHKRLLRAGRDEIEPLAFSITVYMNKGSLGKGREQATRIVYAICLANKALSIRSAVRKWG